MASHAISVGIGVGWQEMVGHCALDTAGCRYPTGSRFEGYALRLNTRSAHRFHCAPHSILPPTCARLPLLAFNQRVVTDAEILAGLRRGDSSAFDTIFREWYPRLVLISDRIVGERQVAEDLAQEVFLELWRRRETLSLETTVHAYLLQSVRNRSLNHLRHVQVRRRSAPEVVEMSGNSTPADAGAVAAELAVAIQDAMQSLTPRCREVFQLSREKGLKYSEIATTLGVSVKAVEAQMGKALRVLRERLAPWLPESETL